MLQYWRKKERELNEISNYFTSGKKKEKLEIELKRREEEEREIHLQKKRLEFLMTQSSFYSQYMAKKMGIEHDQTNQEIHPEVDKEEAMANVHHMLV